MLGTTFQHHFKFNSMKGFINQIKTREVAFITATSSISFLNINKWLTCLIILAMELPSMVYSQGGCGNITFSLDTIGSCCYQLNYVNSSECYRNGTVLIDAGSFNNVTVNAGAGFTATQISPTVLEFNHNQGFFPLGTQSVLTFCVPAGVNPQLDVLWDMYCGIGKGCAQTLQITGCQPPANSIITGLKYRECTQMPYSTQPKLSGWEIQLLNADGVVIGTSVTDDNGNYGFYNLAQGLYVVKESAKPGWTPNVPPTGQYDVDLGISQTLTLNFGNCPDCSCDSLYMEVLPLSLPTQNPCSYGIVLQNTGAYCFDHVTISLAAGTITGWANLAAGWNIQPNGPQQVVLTHQSGYVPLGFSYPVEIMATGSSQHIFTISTTLLQNGSVTECERALSFPCPPAPIPSCCPASSVVGSNLATNGDFEAGHTGFTSFGLPYYFTPGTPTAIGKYSVLQSNQVYSANTQWACVDHTVSSSTGKMLIIDGHNSTSNIAWSNTVTVQSGVQYAFCAYVNNLVIPTKNYADPIVQLWINNVQVATTGSIPEIPDAWVHLLANWTANVSGNIPIEIRLGSNANIGNDFAVDDISFRACSQPPMPCTPEFTFQITCGNVQFTNQSTPSTGLTYCWDFDGNPATCESTAANPTWSFSTCGNYNVCLTVSGPACPTTTICHTVTISDIVPPVALCLGVGVTLDANCQATITPALINSGSTDNCLIANMTVSPAVVTGCGLHPVTLTVTDWCGNISTCSTSVQAIEIVPPVITNCPMLNQVNTDFGKCYYSGSPYSLTATDNCDPSPTINCFLFNGVGFTPITPGFQFPKGEHTIRCNALDNCGNASLSCTFTLKVVETTPPVIVCPPSATKACNTGTTPNDCGFATATDNCDQSPTITFADATTGTLPCNAAITRTWFAADDCGNIASCIQTITVRDNIPPVNICPPHVTKRCDQNTSPADCGSPTATDNCDLNPTITLLTDVVTGSMPCNGTILRSWTARDDCNNTNTCVQVITVIDNVPPTLTNCPQNITVQGIIGSNGQCTAAVQITSPTATDNCDQNVTLTNSFNLTNNASGTYPNGTTTVTWTATDDCNNSVTCSHTLTVYCGTGICCPEFKLALVDHTLPCPGDNPCASSPNHAPSIGPMFIFACKNSTQSYNIVPNLPGFTYTWSIIGGTPASFTGNPCMITWGNGTQGYIEVIVTDATGTCKDTITQPVCLLDGPTAACTVAPGTTVCANQAVTFTNTSTGANTYHWDFGDGTSSSSPNPPPHTYATPGTYTVMLTVSNGAGSNVDLPCGCIDKKSIVITVLAATGPVITSNCQKMLCPGDKAEYCTPLGCAPYSWTVNGGTFVPNSAGNCITVQWDLAQPSTLPASVSVTTGCLGACGSSATLEVPVLWPNIPIVGPKSVCGGSITTYSLPAMPGTFYSWTISTTNGTIISANLNTPTISVQWATFASTGNIITCNYTNPYSGCSGTSTCVVDVKPRFNIGGPSPVCAGAPTSYSTIPGGTANWVISPLTGYTVGSTTNTSSIAVNWTAPGTYTITATTTSPGLYCNSTATTVVTVNPTPIVSLTGPPPMVCPNQLYDFTATSTAPGGDFTWILTGSGGTSSPYGPNNSSSSVNFTGSGPWTLVVSQTVNGCTGTASMNITKVPAPTLPSAPITACIGGQVTVSVATGIGPFTWSSTPAASLISGQGTGTAIYEIHAGGTITVSNCCGPSNAITVNTTTPSAITISQTGSLCAGNLQLTAPACGVGTIYQWFGGSSSNNQTISVTNPGTYTVQVKCPNGCISVATFTVAPVPIPSVSISTGDPLLWCNPQTPSVLLQAYTLSTGCSYQWFHNNSPVGTNTPTFTATAAGSYCVIVTCSGCVAKSNTINVLQQNCPPITGCSTYPIPPNSFPLGVINSTGCNPKTFSVNVIGCSGGTVNWNYGGLGTVTGLNTYTYAAPGAYAVTASINCNGCDFTVHKTVNVPVVADFNTSIVCGTNGSYTVTASNTSQTLGGWTVTGVTWATNCGTPSIGSGNTYNFGTTAFCSNPTITMTITVTNGTEICSDTKTIPLSLPTAPLSIIGPTMVCKDETYIFNSSMTANILQYQWTVNGNPVSQNHPLSYAFNGTPANPVVGLTVTDAFGCTYTATLPVTVKMPRPLTISPVAICPGCTPPASLSTTPTVGFTNYQWYQNGLLVGNSATYQLCNGNPTGNYYVTADDTQNGNCKVTSNTVQVTYHPKPTANIQGQSVMCVSGSGPYTISLANAGGSNPNYSYNWSALPAGSVTFTPNNTTYNATATVTTVGTYQFILTVTDNTTGCMTSDTFCVYLYPKPNLTITSPSGTLCEGKPHTFTTTVTPPGNYVYQWSNGATGPTMTTAQAGVYSCTVTDPLSGCSCTAYAVQIRPSPPVIQLPMGCDTLCDNESITLPLALGGSWFPAGYTIQWFLNEDYNSPPFATTTGTSPTLNLTGLVPSPLAYGTNIITVVVTFGGCSDTSGVYELFIKECCECQSALTLYHGGNEYSLSCDPHVGFIPFLPCPAGDVIISGFHGFYDPITGEPCDETVVIWELTKPDLSTVGGTTTNFTSFIFPKDDVDEPGTYCLTLTTVSANGLNDCVCKIIWVQDDCGDCECGDFSDMNWRPTQGAPNQSINCGSELTLGCLPPNYNVQFGGNFNCIGDDCPPSVVNWELREIGVGNPLVASGTTNGPGFTISIPASSFVFPKSYKLTFVGICDGVECDMCMFTIFTTECPCYCGTFSQLYFPLYRNVQVTPGFCSNSPDDPEIVLACPTPGNSLHLTGLFQCAGPNCPSTAPVTWKLYRLPDLINPVATSSTTANPFFVVNILPLWYSTPGSYQLHLTGHCGLQECPCIIKFKVDCPDPCPCDVPAFDVAVSQGFAITKYPTSCKACFSPLALDDCDEVEWHLNTATGPLIGNTIGNQTICHTFSSSGTYTVVMIVTRKKSDGTLCEVFTKSQTVTITCLIISECTDSTFTNPTFSQGANGGGLGSGGTSVGWSAYAGSPLVVEGEPGSFDAWTIQLSGNFDTSEILSSLEPLCLEKSTGTISLRFGIREKGIKAMMFVDLYRGDNFDLNDCEGSSCYELACIQLDGIDTDEWLEMEIPYDLSNWDASDACGDHVGLLVRPAVYIFNHLVEEQGTDINSVISLDNFCFGGTLVGTDDRWQNLDIRLFPNPTSGALTLEFKGEVPRAGSVQVLDLLGRTLLVKTLLPGEQQHQLSLAAMPAGVYFVKVLERGEPIWAEKIIKQ